MQDLGRSYKLTGLFWNSQSNVILPLNVVSAEQVRFSVFPTRTLGCSGAMRTLFRTLATHKTKKVIT